MNTVKTEDAVSEKVQQFPCRSCGADLLFEPQNGSLTSLLRPHGEIAKSTGEVQERPFRTYLRARPEQMGQLANNVLEVQCQHCGAKSLFMPPEVAGRCEFAACRSWPNPSPPIRSWRPEGVLPFSCLTRTLGRVCASGYRHYGVAPNGLNICTTGEAARDLHSVWVYYTSTSTEYVGQPATIIGKPKRTPKRIR